MSSTGTKKLTLSKGWKIEVREKLHSDQENCHALSRGLGDSEIPENSIINSIKILRKKVPSTGQTQANTQKNNPNLH
jgi:hypothetical protein